MRTKLIVGLLVLGLAVSLLGVGVVSGAQKGVSVVSDGEKSGTPVTVTNTVTWIAAPLIELAITSPALDFGVIGGHDTIAKVRANQLRVRSNISWSLTAEVIGTAAAHLQISFSTARGSGFGAFRGDGRGNAEVYVTYTLVNLRELAVGTHVVTVIFTATVR